MLIDAARWMREGILREGIVDSGWLFCFVHYDVDTVDTTCPRVQLTYDRPGEHLNYPVFLETTQPQLGGLRWWFQCPLCRRRVQKLFLPRGARRFACRHCHQLSYASRNESPYGRAIARAFRIRLRLGGTDSLLDPFPAKPKGMKWKTYDRLQEQYDRYNNASLYFLAQRFHLDLSATNS